MTATSQRVTAQRHSFSWLKLMSKLMSVNNDYETSIRLRHLWIPTICYDQETNVFDLTYST